VTYFSTLSLNFARGTEETRGKAQKNLCGGRDFKPVPTRYESGVLTTVM
jgi:hypothetical protein